MLSSLYSTGITVLICTYNGAAVLPQTLQHLAAQQIPPGLNWEVLLISNASTDDTMTVAPQLWAKLGSPAPMRVLNEPRPGKHFALPLGFEEAYYPYICIVDDDNWLLPEYLRTALEIVAEHPEIGALAGVPEAVCEVTPPTWFNEFSSHYAIGEAAQQSGDITEQQGYLAGAGCIIRKAAWQRVTAANFETLLVKYPGGRVSGDDIEECYALRLAGYRIWFDNRLRLKHFVSAKKLTWAYLYSLYRSSAGAEVDLSPYRHYLQSSADAKPLVWLRDGLYNVRYLLKYKWRAIRAGHWGSALNTVGNQDVLNAEFYWLVVQYYFRKQLQGNKGYDWVKGFQERLQALPEKQNNLL
ncbi:MAG: glycosyltransferase [Hymenobacter sp.]|nr:MAG: glycosyltransferase [Hymenobacter sp.]